MFPSFLIALSLWGFATLKCACDDIGDDNEGDYDDANDAEDDDKCKNKEDDDADDENKDDDSKNCDSDH